MSFFKKTATDLEKAYERLKAFEARVVEQAESHISGFKQVIVTAGQEIARAETVLGKIKGGSK